ncbi:MAG: hypothetical protein R3E79_03885 [Caldilineaceae bacterium]
MVTKVQILLLLTISSCLLAAAQPGKSPQLFIDRSVAPDFAALIQTTWRQFLTVFDARKDCFGDLRIVAVEALADRAQYDPATATVTVRVPARGSALQVALVHEWAHHLEFQCAAQMELRPAFLAAQGLPSDTPWYAEDGSTALHAYQWATIPSEQFAETVVALVLAQQRVRTPARVTEAGKQVIAAWARKGLLP